jgi:multiple sugar transport system substrate-binding protein
MLKPTERLVQTYTNDYLKILYNNIVNTVPDFCLPGGFEYQDALDKEVHACLTGAKKPQAALEDAARVFERITRRQGKDKVRKSWFALTENLAEPIKKATGRANWKL